MKARVPIVALAALSRPSPSQPAPRREPPRRMQPRGGSARRRPRRVLHELVAVCAQLPRQADPGGQLNVLDYAFAGADGRRDVRPQRRVVGLRGADLDRRAERRRRRRRPGEPEPAPVRELQPAAEAEGDAPGPAGRDVDRRLDAVEVLLRRRGHRRDPPGVRRVLRRPAAEGQPALDRRRLAAALRAGTGAAAGIFDGIDIDWEYPGIDPGNGADHSPADVHNATLLLQEFRRQLDAYGASPASTTSSPPTFRPGTSTRPAAGSWRRSRATVDWINLLTFDFHGSWDAWTDFNSPFSLDPKEPAVAGARS